MKTKLFVSIFVMSCTFFFSCQNELEDNFFENSLSAEILKLEGNIIQYSLSGEVLKVETVLEEGASKEENIQSGEKVETVLNDVLKQKIMMEFEQSTSKEQVYLKSAGRLVGVFKNGTCGSYKTLHIIMDCEDNNPLSSQSGSVGDSYIDKAKNAQLFFCVVDGAYFTSVKGGTYGVLRLDATLPNGAGNISRYFDNEDNNNSQNTLLNNVEISNSKKPYKYGACEFGNNTLLSFYYYDPTSTNVSFPELGISYGVLGSEIFTYANGNPYTYYPSGNIFTDDEDKNNKNWAKVTPWSNTLGKHTATYSQDNGNVFRMLEVGKNTRLYISRVR